MKIHTENLKTFWQYIALRHSVYKKKNIELLPSPWTNDEILREYKFTNVFRDLDPGTRYVIEKIIPNVTKLEDLLFNLIIYRLYNKPTTSDAVGWQEIGKYDRKIFEKKLKKLKESGEKIFTNAYMVSGYEQYANFGDKIGRTSKLLEDIVVMIPDIVVRIVKEQNSKITYEAIRSLPGLGEFLAYQIAVDLGYARPDLYDESVHVVAGPGCKRGLDRLFIDRGDLSYEQAIAWLVENQEKGFASVGVNPDELFSDRKTQRLNLMAIENCLCEISKYLKVKYGEGRPRNRYQIRIKN